MKGSIAMTDDKPILPPSLKRGDTLGLFAPAGPITDQQKFTDGIRILQQMGFQVKFPSEGWREDGYLAACDKDRARELHRLWADDDIKAVLAVRGGFGCLRMIDQLDISFFGTHPKMLIGFSDITVLLNALPQQAGVVTYHGPVLTTLPVIDDQSLENFFNVLTGNLLESYKYNKIEILRPGTVSGRLLGGNLTTLVHLLTTDWEISWDETILIIEDTGESMYRIDRMLTQLHAGGHLNKLNGLILGGFDQGEDNLENLRLQEQVWKRIIELTAEYKLPVWGGFPIGHLRQNWTLPLGIQATMDSNRGVLQIHYPNQKN